MGKENRVKCHGCLPKKWADFEPYPRSFLHMLSQNWEQNCMVHHPVHHEQKHVFGILYNQFS